MGLMFRPAENEAIDVRVLFNSFEAKFSNYTSFFGLHIYACLLYTSDAADERSSVDLGGRRISKKVYYERELIITGTWFFSGNLADVCGSVVVSREIAKNRIWF